MLRGAPFAAGLLTALLAAACGGPLDRKDGALRIQMTGVPDEVDALELTLHAGAREFTLARARPANDLVDDFSAVPAGQWTLDLTLLAATTPVARLEGYPVEVVQDRVQEILTPFGDGPMLQVDLRTGAAHPVWAGPIFVEVRDRTEVPPAELILSVHVDGVAQPAPPPADGSWVIQVDPAPFAGARTEPVIIEVEGCYQGLIAACSVGQVAVEVHRRVWGVELGARPAGAPLLLEPEGWLVVGDEQGNLHVVDTETGAPVQAPLTLGGELFGPAVRAGATVAITDRVGAVHGLEIGAGGLTARWRHPLSPRPTPVASDGARFYVGDGARLLALAPADGVEAVLATLSAPLHAAPLADDSGTVAADLLGQVVSLDVQDNLRFRVELGGAVYATPARDAGRVRIATGEGVLITLGPAGGEALEPVALGAPVGFAPVRVASGWAVAAGRSVKFIDVGGVHDVPLGERVMGAPAPWPDGEGVVVGLYNGRVVVVRPDGAKTLGRLEGLALSPVTRAGPPRAFLGSSAGALQALRAEEGF